MKVTKLLAGIAGMLLVGGLAACGDDKSASESGGAGSELTKVRLAFTPGATTLQVHLALTKGIFKKHGLDVRATEGLDLPTWMAGLDKQWDVAMETPGVFVSGANKLDLVVLAGAQALLKDSLQGNPLITRDPSINNPIDLVGKRVGVATLTGSTPTSLNYLVTKAGGDFSKVKLVQVSFEQAGDQLKAGQLDAVVSNIPNADVMLKDPKNRVLWDPQHDALRMIAPAQDPFASILFTSTRKWSEANPKAAQAFQDALQEAGEWMDANEQDAKKELSSWLGTPSDVIAGVKWPLPVRARITPEMLQPVIDLYVAAGVLPKAEAPDLSNRFPVKGN
ncbi:ABC transporter substrate-binding protein [Dactylosporangium sp. NPDC051484]|uniref:ABC transporter substrate-binding protein n=1 Tax=Dactylosporangium sp. NPDC051484 TaxID=3154942 RepID=UPI00344D90CA